MREHDIDASVLQQFPAGVYSKTQLINVDSDLNFEGYRRLLLSHNTTKFVWVNGNTEKLPYIIAPLRESDHDELFGDFKSEILNDILEYLSLLTVRFGNRVQMNPFTFKAYQSFVGNIMDYHEPWIEKSRKGFLRNISYVPRFNSVFTKDESTMIALFRDSIACDNQFYSFLSSFKIFEFHFHDYSSRNSWIEHNFEQARKFAFSANVIRGLGDWDKFLEFVRASNLSIGKYLYKNCRLAIAHATKGQDHISPNVFSQYYEMYYANEVMRALSWYLIFDVLGEKLEIQ